jgi:hypothetical protein
MRRGSLPQISGCDVLPKVSTCTSSFLHFLHLVYRIRSLIRRVVIVLTVVLYYGESLSLSSLGFVYFFGSISVLPTMAALRCGRNSCGIYHHSARLSSSTSVSWKRGGAGDKFSETTSRRIPSLLHQQSLRVANNNNFHLVPLDEKIPPTEDHLSAQNHQQKQQKTYEACFDGEFSQLFRFQLPEGYCVGISLRFLPLDSTSSLVQQEQDQQRRHWLHRYLHPEEISFGYKLKEGVARNTFFLGRLAIRHALFYYNLDGPKSNSTEICSSEIQQYNSAPSATPSSKNSSLKNALHETPSFSILKDKHGRPELPRGFLGSISHKDNIGVALVALIDSAKSKGGTRQGIGIDIEKCEPRSSRIARRVLTLREVESLGHLPVSCCSSE